MTPQSSAGGNSGVGVLSAGTGVVGSLIAGLGQRAAGIQEQRAYDYNADVTMLNTADAMVANEQKYATLVGKQATAYAAAGVDITSGSPLLMMAATAGRGGRQAAQILEAGTEKANLDRYYGKLAAWRGTFGGIQTFLGGLSKGLLSLAAASGDTGGSSGSDNVDWSQITDVGGSASAS